MSLTARSPFRARGPFRLRGPWRLVAGQPWGAGGAESFFDGGKTFDLRKMTLAALLSAGLSNAQATTNPPGTVVGPSGTVQYGAHNLIANSSAAPGSVFSSTVAAAGATPGGYAATQLTRTTANSSVGDYGTQPALTSGVVYTYGLKLSSLDGADMGIQFFDGATIGELRVSATGTFVSQSNVSSYTITPLTNGFYWLAATFTSTGTGSGYLRANVYTNGARIVAGEPQLCRGNVATNYVPTTTAAVYAPRLTCERGATHNWIRDSGDLSTGNWTRRGTATAVPSTLSNGVAATLISVGAAFTSDVYQLVQGQPVGARIEPAFWVQRVSTTGLLRVYNTAATGQGQWDIDLSKLADGPQWVTRSHPAVTITAEFTGVSGTYSGGVLFAAASGSVSAFVSPAQWVGSLPPPAYLRTFATAPLYSAGTPTQQNLANGSGTQSITVTAGCVYSILHQTGGTYTLSGAATGTTTAGTTTTFVAATGTLTLTASSAPTLLQVWEGTGSMAYVAGPVSVYPQRAMKREPQRTNILPNSATIGAQSITVTSTSVYTFSFEGSSSSVTFSGAYTGTLSTDASGRRQSVTFTAATGTLTIASVTGSPVLGQLELGGWATTYIPNGATTTTRSADLLRPGNVITDGPMTVLVQARADKAAAGASQVLVGRTSAGQSAVLDSTGKPAMFDGTNAVVAAAAVADGVSFRVAASWGGSTQGVSGGGNADAAGAFDGTMGSGSVVGFGDDGTGGNGASVDFEVINIVAQQATAAQRQALMLGTLQ